MTRHRIVFRSLETCGLGRVPIAGAIEDGRGVSPARSLDCFVLVYLLAGGGAFSSGDDGSQAVSAGDCLLLFPNVPHEYGPRARGAWDEIYVAFDGPVFRLWRDRGVLDPARPVLRASPVAYWGARVRAVLADEAPMVARVCRMQQLLADLLAESSANERRIPENERWAAAACHLLELRVDGRAPSARAVARGMDMGYEAFRKRFARLVGEPPERWRARRAMDDVCRRLLETGMTLREIADAHGFADAFHLSRRFKRLVGMSPSAFRAASADARRADHEADAPATPDRAARR